MQQAIMKLETFNLYGYTWTVIYVDKIETEKDAFQWGLTDHVNRRICVATKDSEGKPFPKEEIELTKLHEIMHCILGTGMYGAYSDDEPLVEWLARSIFSLRQLKTIK